MSVRSKNFVTPQTFLQARTGWSQVQTIHRQIGVYPLKWLPMFSKWLKTRGNLTLRNRSFRPRNKGDHLQRYPLIDDFPQRQRTGNRRREIIPPQDRKLSNFPPLRFGIFGWRKCTEIPPYESDHEPKSITIEPKSKIGGIFLNCILGAINLHTPLLIMSESIARVGRKQKPVFPDLKTGFLF